MLAIFQSSVIASSVAAAVAAQLDMYTELPLGIFSTTLSRVISLAGHGRMFLDESALTEIEPDFPTWSNMAELLLLLLIEFKGDILSTKESHSHGEDGVEKLNTLKL